jgi:hypothetical protein
VALCRIQRAIGALQQCVGRGRERVPECDADAGRHADDVVAGTGLAAHRSDDLAGDDPTFFPRVNPFEDDDELVAGEARDDIGRAHRTGQPARELTQHVVAGRVAERVVDPLEAVDVEEQ